MRERTQTSRGAPRRALALALASAVGATGGPAAARATMTAASASATPSSEPEITGEAPSPTDPGDAPRGESASEVPPAAPVGTVATPEPLGGGYWGPLGRPPPAPDDGRWLTWTGAVMLPLGVLRVGMGGVFLYGAAPSRCGDWFGDDFANEPGRCGSLATYGYWGIAFGAVMAVTGAVLLGVGAHRARAYRRWKVQWGWRGMAPHGRAGHSSVRPPWHVEGPAVLRF